MDPKMLSEKGQGLIEATLIFTITALIVSCIFAYFLSGLINFPWWQLMCVFSVLDVLAGIGYLFKLVKEYKEKNKLN